MDADLTALREQRPENREVSFSLTPEYYKHQPYEDQLAILVCQIKIWRAEGTDWFKIPSANGHKCLTIRECESIEITDSAKDLLGKAVVRFPRGTVIHYSSNPEKDVNIETGVINGEYIQESLIDASNDGEFLSPSISTYSKNNVPVTSIAPNYDHKGLIDFNRTTDDPALLSPNDVAIGNRIEIRLGYAYSNAEAEEINSTDSHSSLDVVFTGFITSISADTPLELECTNMAHILASVSAPDVIVKNSMTVKDFLDDDGQYHVLKDTGISLSESSKKCEIVVRGGVITNNLTIADVLTEWGKCGIVSLMELDNDGVAQLRVGLAYNAGKKGNDLPNNDKKYITYNGGNNSVKILQFDWDVAQDKLTLKNNDKKYLAIEAHGTDSKGKLFKLTIRKNPDEDDEGWLVGDNEQFQVVNVKDPTAKKGCKRSDGTMNTQGKKINKIDLSKYDVRTYISTTIPITKDILIQEAAQYWLNFNPNGISGSLVIFGDVVVKPTDIIGLIDPLHPQKNGYYYVESVNTTFGVQGYRRELTIPFKIASFQNQVKIIQ